MQRLLHDLRFALRQLRKSPGFAVTTILTLALGIGATTTIFSLVNAVLLRPLPFPEQDRLVSLQIESRTSGVALPGNVSYPDFFDWRSQQRSFTGIAAYRNGSVTLTGVGDAQELTSEIVSKEFFQVLGVRPRIGREFRADEEKPNAHAAILSHQLWQSRFGGAPDIVGRAITLDGESYTVAGVMPPDFAFPIQNPPIALWTSIGDDKQFFTQRGADVLEILGRLKPDASLANAKAQMDVIARNLAAQYPDSNKQQTAVMAKPVLEQLVGDTRPALRILFSAVALVLLIACANVAGLLLARASRRRTDIALQSALGASAGEIIRQILVESLVVSLIAGACGIILSVGRDAWASTASAEEHAAQNGSPDGGWRRSGLRGSGLDSHRSAIRSAARLAHVALRSVASLARRFARYHQRAPSISHAKLAAGDGNRTRIGAAGGAPAY